MKKALLTIAITVLALSVSAQAQRRGVPATPYPIEHIQPKGDTLKYRLYGDEHRHLKTTLDEYYIQIKKRNKMCYAKFNKKGEMKTTCRTAHNAEDRSARERKYVEKHIPNFYLERKEQEEELQTVL
jgi:hypothetical protein